MVTEKICYGGRLGGWTVLETVCSRKADLSSRGIRCRPKTVHDHGSETWDNLACRIIQG